MFRDELAATMQACFSQFAPGQPQAVPVVMRVTKLEIDETYRLGAAMGRATMEAVFFAPQAAGSYRAVASFAQTFQRSLASGTGAVLAGHAANLGALFLSAATVGANQTAWLATGPTYSMAQLTAVQQPKPETSLPLLKPGDPRKPGFYYSWAEFRADSPGGPGVPEVETRPYAGSQWIGDDEIKPYHHALDGKRVLAMDVWGFSDGQQVYIRQDQDFYRLRPHENDYIFFGRTGTGALGHSAINVLGVASAAYTGVGAFSTNPEHRALYRLSTATGFVSLSPSMGTSISSGAERPAQLFVYRPRSAKGPAVRIRLSTGEAPQELLAGDYLSFSPPIGATVTGYLMPATGPETLLPVIPTSMNAIYLECRPAETTPLRQVKENTGAAAVTRLIK